ncbi:MAG TPA: phosphatidylserine decarboxylase family protein [Ignavibacteriaceae bacterium]|nr:phosphatidylserine decarboxylase family protein [Ignavibacteriaceae bacterium]
MFTKYGYSTLGTITAICISFISLSFLIQNSFVKFFIVSLLVVFLLFSLYFFRDPDRDTPKKDNIIVSPADGKILLVKNVSENKFINGESRQISIFMSPLNVHVNRIPIDGRVDYIKYYSGKYLAAFEDKASDENERAEFGITAKQDKILFTQVAGFIARRIIYKIKEGDIVKMGERFGMIKFGSRVDVIAPASWDTKVIPGDKVIAGVTILFERSANQ